MQTAIIEKDGHKIFEPWLSTDNHPANHVLEIYFKIGDKNLGCAVQLSTEWDMEDSLEEIEEADDPDIHVDIETLTEAGQTLDYGDILKSIGMTDVELTEALQEAFADEMDKLREAYDEAFRDFIEDMEYAA